MLEWYSGGFLRKVTLYSKRNARFHSYRFVHCFRSKYPSKWLYKLRSDWDFEVSHPLLPPFVPSCEFSLDRDSLVSLPYRRNIFRLTGYERTTIRFSTIEGWNKEEKRKRVLKVCESRRDFWLAGRAKEDRQFRWNNSWNDGRYESGNWLYELITIVKEGKERKFPALKSTWNIYS